MNKEFQAANNMYNQLFRCASEECIAVSDLDIYELEDWGFSTLSKVERIERMEDTLAEMHPSDFDSRGEYNQAVKEVKSKYESMVVVTPETMMVACVNYKGEFEKMVPDFMAEKFPMYVSKAASFAHFGM